MIADCVDVTLFRLMMAIDNGDVQLSFRSSDGTFVGLAAEGFVKKSDAPGDE